MPGRIHPTSQPRFTASPVEPRVFEALRAALPDGWEAWHSLRFAYGPHRLLKEIDFVLLVPRRGLFLVEVKGGRWTREDGRWHHDGRPCGSDGPLEQVLDAQSRLRHELAARLGAEGVPSTQPVLLFPDVHSAIRGCSSTAEPGRARRWSRARSRPGGRRPSRRRSSCAGPARWRRRSATTDSTRTASVTTRSRVRALATERFWAFGDEAQRFWSDRTVPSDLGMFRVDLTTTYRCPRAIQSFVDSHVAGGDVRTFERDEVRVVASEDGLGEITRLLGRWLAQGVAPSDIAVLSLAGRDTSELASRGSIGDVRVVAADDDEAGANVVLDTFLRFKGLERPFVVVAELDRVRGGFDVRMRIAASRATVGLVIVASPTIVASDPRLAAVARAM